MDLPGKFEFDYITVNSVVRAHLDVGRRELIPWDTSLPAPIFMDVVQLRVCDMEFIVRLDWRTPYPHPEGYRVIHASSDRWKPDWCTNYSIPSILRKTYEVYRDNEPETSELGQRVLLQSRTR